MQKKATNACSTSVPPQRILTSEPESDSSDDVRYSLDLGMVLLQCLLSVKKQQLVRRDGTATRTMQGINSFQQSKEHKFMLSLKKKVTSFSTSRTLTRTETHLTFNSKYSQKMWYASHVCCWKVLQNSQQHICINKSFHTQICICCSLHMKYMFATLFLNILYVVCNLIISTLGSSTVQNKDGKGKRSIHLKTWVYEIWVWQLSQ